MSDLVETREGYVEMVLDVREGMVVQEFKEPMKKVIYEPNNALEVAMRMSDLAFHADTSMKPVGDTLKAEIVERHRMTLTNRVSLMLNSLREDKKKSNGQVAQEVVDACLKEVF